MHDRAPRAPNAYVHRVSRMDKRVKFPLFHDDHPNCGINTPPPISKAARGGRQACTEFGTCEKGPGDHWGNGGMNQQIGWVVRSLRVWWWRASRLWLCERLTIKCEMGVRGGGGCRNVRATAHNRSILPQGHPHEVPRRP